MKAFWKFMDRLEEGMIFVSFMGMMGTVILQVVTRVFFSKALIFTEELARYLYIWLTFSGMSWLYHHHANISLSIVTDRFSPKQMRIFNIISNTVTFGVLVLLLTWCFDFLKFQSTNVSPAMHANMALVYGILPISFVMTCIRLVQSTVEDIRELKDLAQSKEVKK